MAAQSQAGFLECARMRTRPVGPAQSSALHDFARSGPTKEAHRWAMNRSGGLQRSVAGQGHARVLRVTLPSERLTKANGPRPATTAPSPPEGPIRGGVEGPIRGGIRGPYGDRSGGSRGGREIAVLSSGWPLGIASANSATGRSGGLNRPRRGRDPAPGRVRPMPSPGGYTIRPDRRQRQARSSSAAGVGHRDDPRVRAACRGSSLTSGRTGWPRVGPTGPAQSPSCSEATGSSQGARGAPAHRASVLAAVPDGAASLVVGRGGGIEPGLVACLPDADHNKMRAHGHASELPERPPRDPSLHLTAPYAIPPLSCGNTLQPGAARGVAS